MNGYGFNVHSQWTHAYGISGSYSVLKETGARSGLR